MRNFSEGGALLVFNGPFALPDRFRLTVDAKGLDVMCEVRRRNGSEFGVQFVQEQADIESRLAEELAAEATEPVESPPPPVLLSAIGLVTVVPGHEMRRLLIA